MVVWNLMGDRCGGEGNQLGGKYCCDMKQVESGVIGTGGR